ncbi:MAG: hypothetical protein ABEJ61_08340 [Haloferacaceae archaeon]
MTVSETDADVADDARRETGRAVSIATREEGPGLVVTDHVERHRLELWTDDPVVPEPADGDRFRFPTDAAVAVRAAGVTIPTVMPVYVRNADGEMLAEIEQGGEASFPPGVYDVELCAPMKVYVRVEGALDVTLDALRGRLEFDGERRVLVGGRSHHERPAATVTTTADPEDVMRAVSTFGSALKTTSPERSYPTLRGHPPLVELGDALDVPPGLEPPDTGVEVVLPPELGSVYAAAPLAHYLGAEVVPGSGTPRVVTDAGLEIPLDGPDGYEAAVQATLEHTFLLDCVVRTEGYYEVDLHEREQFERRVSLDRDLAELYELPLAERLRAYHGVPHDAVADLVPDWGLATYVAPDPEHVEVLPFLTDDLAVVRTPETRGGDASGAGGSDRTAATAAFFRNDASGATGEAAFTRSSGATTDTGSYVRPEPTDALEEAWVGEGTPVGATKALPEAYRNRLDRSPVEEDIDITVVCNDPAMAAELDVGEDVYGSREDFPYDVTVHEQLSRAELRRSLTVSTELFHYIGHIDDRGFECADGRLDAGDLATVGVDAFLLNACQSYRQGAELVRAGAIAGIVTLDDVINDGAVRMGRLLARLLNEGFPLAGALDVAAEASSIGDQYTLVGDGRLTLARTEGSPPNAPVVLTVEDGTYELDYHTYPTNRHSTGSMIVPYVQGNDQYYLLSGVVDTFELDAEELAEFLSLETVPVRLDGELYWSDELDVDAL